MAWKVNLYRGYLAICNPDDHHLNVVRAATDRMKLNKKVSLFTVKLLMNPGSQIIVGL